jgi:hypothetical protein
MPGYDDRKARPGSGFAQGRDGGDYYRQSWQAAIASKPQWVIVNSFNEWPEGSYIEPSKAYGNLYLDLTREWAGRFRSADLALKPAAPAPPPAAPTPRPTMPPPTPTPAPPPVARLWTYGQEDIQAYLGRGCGFYLSGVFWVLLCPSSGGAGQGDRLAY